MKRKLIIVSPVRFFISICIVVGLIVGIIIASLNQAQAETYNSYKEIEIEEGDTLWEIAAEHTDNNKDIREVIYDICKLNDIKAGNIAAGDKIVVPTNI